LNILDQRLIVSGHLELLHKLGVEIHARSVFLQGLLLMDPELLPPYFENFRAQLLRVRDYAAERHVSPLRLSLAFVKELECVSAAVVGATSVKDLNGIVSAWQSTPPSNSNYADLRCDEEQLVNPSHWIH
jgi:aryl-alcohol dehydrogenase-like predicted oxidoreductase